MKLFSHITILTKNLDRALESYRLLLAMSTQDGSGGMYDNSPTAKIAAIPTVNGILIEFIQPKGNDPRNDVFNNYLDNHGEGIFSYCLFVDNFDEEIEQLKQQGTHLQEAVQEFLFPGYPFRLAWITPEDGLGTRVELVDYNAVPPWEQKRVNQQNNK